LAGTPHALDSVPLLAKRQIVFSSEQISGDAELVCEALNAYYADNEQVVVDFCQTYGVDYLVVNLQAYSEEQLASGQIFYEPYNQEVYPRIIGQDAFVLEQVSDEIKVFQSGDLFVAPCSELVPQL
jgi:hypothetical protein